MFQLTFNPTETNIEAQYRLLRFIGKRGVLTHREMATAIDIGVGSIRNYLDKLMVEGFLEGLKSNPKISTEGLRLLTTSGPKNLASLNRAGLSKATMCPSEQPCPSGRPSKDCRVDNPPSLRVLDCPTWTTIWTTVFKSTPLKGVDTEPTEHGVVEIKLLRT